MVWVENFYRNLLHELLYCCCLCFLTVCSRAWVRILKQRVPITSKSSKFKGETQHYVVKLPKSAGARHYCTKIQLVPGPLAPVLTQALCSSQRYTVVDLSTNPAPLIISVLFKSRVLWSQSKYSYNSKLGQIFWTFLNFYYIKSPFFREKTGSIRTVPSDFLVKRCNFCFMNVWRALESKIEKGTIKVWTFWEGYKIWKNLPLKIWHYSVVSNFRWKIFSNFVFFSECPNFISTSGKKLNPKLIYKDIKLFFSYYSYWYLPNEPKQKCFWKTR